MSDALDLVRTLDPRLKSVSDSELTSFLYARHPELLQDTQFRDSVKQQFSAEAQNPSLAPDAPTEDDKAQSRTDSAFQSMLRKAGQGLGSTVGMLGRFAENGMGAGISDTVTPYKNDTERELDIEKNPAYRYGQAISSAAQAQFRPNPKYKGEFLADELPSTVGGLIPTFAAGAINPALGTAQFATQFGQEQAEDAIRAGRPDVADTAANQGVAVGGAMEAVGGQFAKYPARVADRILGRAVTSTAVKDVAKSATKASAEMGVLNVGGNAIASTGAGYDPERGIAEGLPDALLSGAILGTAMKGGEHVAGSAAKAVNEFALKLSETAEGRSIAKSMMDRLDSSERGLVPDRFSGNPSDGARPETQLELAERLIRGTRRPSLDGLQRAMGTTPEETQAIIAQLESNGVLGPINIGGSRDVLARRAKGSDVSQTAPPQTPTSFTITEAPRGARAIPDSVTSSGVGQTELGTADQSPVDALIAANADAPRKEAARRANAAAIEIRNRQRRQMQQGLTLPQDSGKFESDSHRPASALPDSATSSDIGNSPDTVGVQSPIDQYVGRQLDPIHPDLQRMQDAAAAELASLSKNPDQNTVRRDQFVAAIPDVTRILNRRIEDAIDKRVNAKYVEPLIQLSADLSRFHEQHANRNAELASGIADMREQRAQLSEQEARLNAMRQDAYGAFSGVPAYADGASIKVGDFVRVGGKAFGHLGGVGRTVVTGEVVEINGTKPVVRITKANGLKAGKAGVYVGTKHEIHDASLLTPAIREVDQPEAAAAHRPRGEYDQKMVDLLNASSNDPFFPEYMKMRDAGDTAALKELNKFETGKKNLNRAVGMRAAYLLREHSGNIEARDTTRGAFNEEEATNAYLKSIHSWMRKSIEAGKQVRFAEADAAKKAIQPGRGNEIEKKTLTDSQVSDEESGDSFIENVEKGESAPDRLAAIGVDVNKLSDAVAAGYGAAELHAGGRKLTPTEREAIIGDALRSQIASAKLAEKLTPAQLEHIANSLATSIEAGTHRSYESEGIEAVREQIADDDSVLMANRASHDNGNRSLQLGDTDLRGALSTVLKSLPADSPIRPLADLLLKHGVNPRVAVLSDDAFDSFGPRYRREVAFYDPAQDAIIIRQSAKSHDYLIAHEAVHAATVAALRTNPQFLKAILRLRAEAISEVGHSRYGLSEHGSDYANAAEFIADAFASPEMRRELSQIDAVGIGSLWDKFKGFVKGLFGINHTKLTLLDQVLDSASREFRTAQGVNWSDKSDLFAAKPYNNAKQVADALLVPTTTEGKEAVEHIARTTQFLIHPDISAGIKESLMPAADLKRIAAIDALTGSDRADAIKSAAAAGFDYQGYQNDPKRKAYRALQFVFNTAELTDRPGIHLGTIDVRTDEGARLKREAASAVDVRGDQIVKRKAVVESQLAKLQEAAASPEDNLNRALEELTSTEGMIASSGREAADQFDRNLHAQRVLAGAVGPSTQQVELSSAAKAERHFTRTSAIGRAMSAIANKLTPQEIASFKTNKELLAAAKAAGAFDNVAKIDGLLPDEATGDGGILSGYTGLRQAVARMRELADDKASANATIDAFRAEIAAAKGTKDRPVTVRQWAKDYTKLVLHLNEIDKISSAISDRAVEIQSLGHQLEALDNVAASPDFRNQRWEAVKTLDKMIRGAEGVTKEGSNLHVYTVGPMPGKHQTFEFFNTVSNPEMSQHNAETAAKMLSYIDGQLAPGDIEPVYRQTLEYQKALAQRDLLTERTDGRLWYGMLDIVAWGRLHIPVFKELGTVGLISKLIEGRLGVALRTLNSAEDSIQGKVSDLRDHRVYGRRAQIIATNAAVKSHEADIPRDLTGEDRKKWWVKNVLQRVLSQNQDRKADSLSAGDYVRRGVKITREDMRAAYLMAKWSDQLRKIVETEKGAAEFYPTRIVEGDTTRLSFAQGSLTVAMMLNRRASPSGNGVAPLDFARKWTRLERPDKASLLNEPAAFEELALALVKETNPGFTVKSKYKDAYRALEREWRKSGDDPENIDQLVEAIADKLPPMTVDTGANERTLSEKEKRAVVLDDLITTIDRATAAFKLDLDKANQSNREALSGPIGPMATNPHDATVMDQMDAENTFRQPRRAMVAPSNFYDFELASPENFGGLERAATMGITIKRIKAMMEIGKQLASEVADMRAGRVDGKQSYTIAQMDRLIAQVGTMQAHLVDTIRVTPAGSEDGGVLAAVFNLLKQQFLATLSSTSNNFALGLGGGRYAADAALFGFSQKNSVSKRLLHVPGTVVDFMRSMMPGNRSFTRWADAHGGADMAELLRSAHSDANEFIRARAYMGEDASTLRQDIEARIGGPRQFTKSDNLGGRAERALNAVLSTTGVRHAVAMLPYLTKVQERETNLLSTVHFDQALRKYFGKLAQIIDAREKNGQADKLNFSNPSSRFTPDELQSIGISIDTWAKNLKMFGEVSTKSLEQMASEYRKIRDDAKANGQDWRMAPFTHDVGTYDGVIRALGQLNNVAASSNRPDVFKGRTRLASIMRSMIPFPGWSNGWLDTHQFLNMVSKDRGHTMAAVISAKQVAITAMSLAAMGYGWGPIKALIYRMTYGRPYTAETMVDLLRNPDGAMFARVTGAALAMNLPYYGEYIASAMGAQNYRPNISDLGSISIPIRTGLALKDAVVTYSKTGDALGAAVSVTRAIAPTLSPVLNRLPEVESRSAVNDASRVALVNRGDLAVPDKGMTGTGQVTEFSNTVALAAAAMARGDVAAAQGYRDKAIAIKTAAGDPNGIGAFRSALQARRPEMRAFGRVLTPNEKTSLLERMSPEQRGVFNRADNAVDSLLALSGGAARQRGASGIASGTSSVRSSGERLQPRPLADLARRFRSLKEAAKPMVLKQIKRKLTSLKPMHLSSGSQSSAASVSRLVRQPQSSPSRAAAAKRRIGG